MFSSRDLRNRLRSIEGRLGALGIGGILPVQGRPLRLAAVAIALCAFSWASPSPSSAETRTKIASSGKWSLYSVDGVETSLRGKPSRVLDDMCLAEFATPMASFQIVMMSARTADKLQSIRGCPWVQISSPNWSFRDRTRAITLAGSGSFTMTVGGAEYRGDSIKFSVGGVDDCTAFQYFMLFAKGTIDVQSGGKTIARFPTTGFPKIRSQLLDCAGVNRRP